MTHQCLIVELLDRITLSITAVHSIHLAPLRIPTHRLMLRTRYHRPGPRLGLRCNRNKVTRGSNSGPSNSNKHRCNAHTLLGLSMPLSLLERKHLFSGLVHLMGCVLRVSSAHTAMLPCLRFSLCSVRRAVTDTRSLIRKRLRFHSSRQRMLRWTHVVALSRKPSHHMDMVNHRVAKRTINKDVDHPCRWIRDEHVMIPLGTLRTNEARRRRRVGFVASSQKSERFTSSPSVDIHRSLFRVRISFFVCYVRYIFSSLTNACSALLMKA